MSVIQEIKQKITETLVILPTVDNIKDFCIIQLSYRTYHQLVKELLSSGLLVYKIALNELENSNKTSFDGYQILVSNDFKTDISVFVNIADHAKFIQEKRK